MLAVGVAPESEVVLRGELALVAFVEVRIQTSGRSCIVRCYFITALQVTPKVEGICHRHLPSVGICMAQRLSQSGQKQRQDQLHDSISYLTRHLMLR